MVMVVSGRPLMVLKRQTADGDGYGGDGGDDDADDDDDGDGGQRQTADGAQAADRWW